MTCCFLYGIRGGGRSGEPVCNGGKEGDMKRGKAGGSEGIGKEGRREGEGERKGGRKEGRE